MAQEIKWTTTKLVVIPPGRCIAYPEGLYAEEFKIEGEVPEPDDMVVRYDAKTGTVKIFRKPIGPALAT